MNHERDPIDDLIGGQLSPPKMGPDAQAQFTRSVMAANQRRIRQKTGLMVMVPLTCALVFWVLSNPMSQPDEMPGAPMTNTLVTPPEFEAPADDLEELWAEHWADLEESEDSVAEGQDNESETYGDIAWMPSHHQAFSEILGLNEEEESL